MASASASRFLPCLSSCHVCLWWRTVIWKCKSDSSFPPRLVCGYCVSWETQKKKPRQLPICNLSNLSELYVIFVHLSTIYLFIHPSIHHLSIHISIIYLLCPSIHIIFIHLSSICPCLFIFKYPCIICILSYLSSPSINHLSIYLFLSIQHLYIFHKSSALFHPSLRRTTFPYWLLDNGRIFLASK